MRVNVFGVVRLSMPYEHAATDAYLKHHSHSSGDEEQPVGLLHQQVEENHQCAETAPQHCKDRNRHT